MKRFALFVLLLAALIGMARANLLISTTTTVAQAPFGNGGSPWPVVGTQVLAVNYDTGGSGKGYVATGFSNACTAPETTYRPPDCINFKSDTSGTTTWKIGFSVAPNAYSYTVTSGSTQTIQINAFVSSDGTATGWNVLVDGNPTSPPSTIVTPNTGGYDGLPSNYALASSSAFTMPSGRHVLTLQSSGGGGGDIVYWQGQIPVVGQCDFGNGLAGTAPSRATLAGFTKCVMSEDFTQVSNASQVIHGCGAPANNWPSTAGSFYATYFLDNSGADLNCNRTTIVTDPVHGGNILQFQFLTSDAAQVTPSATKFEWSELDWPIYFSQQSPPVLPLGMYKEITFWFPVTSLQQTIGTTESWDFWDSPSGIGAACCQPNGAAWVLETDVLEIVDAQSNGQTTFFGGGAGAPCCFPLINTAFTDWTQIHTVAGLTTTNGSSSVANCLFLDAAPATGGTTLIGCNSGSPNTNFFQQIRDRTIALNIGGEGGSSCGLSQGLPQCIINNVVVYVKSIRAYSCPSYKTTACPGTLVTSENVDKKRKVG